MKRLEVFFFSSLAISVLPTNLPAQSLFEIGALTGDLAIGSWQPFDGNFNSSFRPEDWGWTQYGQFRMPAGGAAAFALERNGAFEYPVSETRGDTSWTYAPFVYRAPRLESELEAQLHPLVPNQPLAETLTKPIVFYCEGADFVCGGLPTVPVPIQPLNPEPSPPVPTTLASWFDLYGYGCFESNAYEHTCGYRSASGEDPEAGFHLAGRELIAIARNIKVAAEIPQKSLDGFPSIVGVAAEDGAVCTGILLSPRIVATAAHCVCDSRLDHAWIGNSMVADPEYRAGLNASREFSDLVRLFDDDYCDTGDGIDLAVAYLREGSAVTNEFFHEDLPTGTSTASAFDGEVVGFGASEGSLLGGVKRHARIVAEPCTNAHALSEENCIPDREWIAFSRNGVDTCKGDSGGPLYSNAPDGSLRLVGLTSRKRGGGSAEYCGDGGIYVNLTRPDIRDWLKNLVKGDQS